jgi:putative intracellular protease/amidase
VGFFADHPSMQARTLRSVIDEGLDDYAAGFVPGGQAPVVDLMQDAEVGEVLRHFHDRKKPTAFLCHGPMAAVAAMPHAPQFRAALIAGDTAKATELARGWQYAGYKMTVFSASEEKVIEDNILHAKLYFNMPDALRIAGADVSVTPIDFDPYVVEDRELITGQNLRSDKPIAERLIQTLARVTVTA